MVKTKITIISSIEKYAFGKDKKMFFQLKFKNSNNQTDFDPDEYGNRNAFFMCGKSYLLIVISGKVLCIKTNATYSCSKIKIHSLSLQKNRTVQILMHQIQMGL